MRTDRRHRSADVDVACRSESRPEVAFPRLLVDRADVGVRPCDVRVRDRQGGRETSEQVDPRRDERSAGAGEPLVPHIERGQRALTPAVPAGHLLQERVPLPEDAIEVGPQHVELRAARHEQVVEVAPTSRGTTFHHLEVIRSEHGDSQRTEQVTRARESLPVHLHP